jgi:hypothetical protein
VNRSGCCCRTGHLLKVLLRRFSPQRHQRRRIRASFLEVSYFGPHCCGGTCPRQRVDPLQNSPAKRLHCKRSRIQPFSSDRPSQSLLRGLCQGGRGAVKTSRVPSLGRSGGKDLHRLRSRYNGEPRLRGLSDVDHILCDFRLRQAQVIREDDYGCDPSSYVQILQWT